jgi:hypothetical protein
MLSDCCSKPVYSKSINTVRHVFDDGSEYQPHCDLCDQACKISMSHCCNVPIEEVLSESWGNVGIVKHNVCMRCRKQCTSRKS